MEEERVNMENRRCSLCIEEAFHLFTPPEKAAFMNLRCGHQIHTNCFLIHVYTRFQNVLTFDCPICEILPLDTPLVEWLFLNRRPVHTTHTDQDLWNTNEEFRNDIRALSKIQKESSKYLIEYKKETTTLKRDWKNTMYTTLEFVKDQRRIFKRRLFGLGVRKKAISSIRRITQERNRMLNKYPSLTWQSFRNLRNIPGAPKLKHYPRSLLWRYLPYNLFRFSTFSH